MQLSESFGRMLGCYPDLLQVELHAEGYYSVSEV